MFQRMNDGAVAARRLAEAAAPAGPADGEALLRTSLRELLPRLDASHFKQIHRSTIVNMRMVQSIVRDDSGRGTMKLKNRPETLAVSLTFMPVFRNM